MLNVFKSRKLVHFDTNFYTECYKSFMYENLSINTSSVKDWYVLSSEWDFIEGQYCFEVENYNRILTAVENQVTYFLYY